MLSFSNNSKKRHEVAAPAEERRNRTVEPYARGAALSNEAQEAVGANLQSEEETIRQRNAEIEQQRIAFAEECPEFDMKTEMQNPRFVSYVWGAGLTVAEAYILVHFEELIEKAREEASEEFSGRRERIRENGAGQNRPAMAKKNPKDLTDREIEEILERVGNGERVTF